MGAEEAVQIAEIVTDVKHSLFSYFLMKGMEGDADTDGNNTYQFSLGVYLASLWGDMTFEVTVLDAPEPVTATPDPIIENPIPIVEDPVPIVDFPDPFVGLPEF